MEILASPARLVLSLLAAGIPLKSALGAEETFWKAPPAAIGDWFEPANWTNGVPTSDDYQGFAIISNGGTARVEAGTAQPAQLSLGGTLSGKLIVDGGRVEVLYNAYLGRAPDAHGRLDLNGGTFAAESIIMGYNRGQGKIEQTGGTLDAPFVQLGSPYLDFPDYHASRTMPQDYGAGDYHMLGGRLTASLVEVGNSGIGVVRQEGGTATIEQRLIVGGAIASLPPSYDGPTNWPLEPPIIIQPLTPVLRYSADLWIPPPVPSQGRYELAGGSLTVRKLEVATTGTVEQTGGTLNATYVEIAPDADYVYEAGALNVAAGLHSNGGFDFQGSSARLVADNAILNFAGGLENAQSARIEAGSKSLTILPADFDIENDLGSLTTQGLVHVVGDDLTIPVGRSVEGWGEIPDHAIVAGTIDASDAQAAINLNGLELRSTGSVKLHHGVLNVTDDRTVLRGGSFDAAGINVYGDVDYHTLTIDDPTGDGTSEYQTPVYTPGLARQTAGTVDGGYVSISNGRYEISGGTLTALSIEVGAWNRGGFIPASPTERAFVQRGGRVVTGSLSLSMPYLTYNHADWTWRASDAQISSFLPSLFDPPARYELHRGSLEAERIYVGMGWSGNAAEFIQTGGEVLVSQTLGVTGQGSSYVMTGGNLRTRRLYVGDSSNIGESSGTFSILNKNTSIEVAGEIHFGHSANFVAVPGATIRLTRPAPPGQYEFPSLTGNKMVIEGTDSNALSGLSNLTLLFDGGGDLPATLEAAGEDRGPSLAGFYQNFTIHTLMVGGAETAALSLVDLIDNQPGSELPNALYVDNLIVNAGSTLDLNGLKLYYRTATILGDHSLAASNFGIQVVPEPTTACLALLLATPICLRRRR